MIVPVEPVWPKVFSEEPLASEEPTTKAKPRGVTSGGLWLAIMRRAVTGFTQAPDWFRNSARNFARSGAEACVPPHGAPSLRQYGLFQSHSLAFGSPPPDSG